MITLIAIARAHIKLNNTKEARALLKNASKLQNSCPLSKPYAELGDLRKAFNVAQECSIYGNTQEKIEALATILAIHAEQINPELKQLRAKNIATPNE